MNFNFYELIKLYFTWDWMELDGIRWYWMELDGIDSWFNKKTHYYYYKFYRTCLFGEQFDVV